MDGTSYQDGALNLRLPLIISGDKKANLWIITTQVQGSIRLKLWLSSREERRRFKSEEEEEANREMEQQLLLYNMFVDHQISKHQVRD